MSGARSSMWVLVLVPALIALAVTIAFANPYLEVTDCCKPAPATTTTTTQ